MSKDYRIYKRMGRRFVSVLALLGALSVALSCQRASKYSDEETFILKDGETAWWKVKQNIANVAEIQITPHIVPEGTQFKVGIFDTSGEPMGLPSTAAIRDGDSMGIAASLSVKGREVLYEIQLTPKRQDQRSVVVEAKALFEEE